MRSNSMSGSEALGADPQRYFDGAVLTSTLPLGYHSILDDPTSSFYEHIHGNLLRYQIAGESRCYLELAAIPEIMMGAKGNAVLLPDLVCGKPLIPVSVSDDRSKTGLFKICLESGAFTRGEEINAGYQIAAKVRVGPVEYAMGERYGKFPSFVTWERTPAHDDDGAPNYYWGHYFESRDQALQDFCDRAGEKHKELAEDRKTRAEDRKPSIKAQLTAAKAARTEKPAVQQHKQEKGAR